MSDEPENEPLSTEDERLLADLGGVLGPDLPPEGLVARAAGLAAYADLERELVELLAASAPEPVGSRGAATRDVLSFELEDGSVSIQLRVRADALVGQVLAGDLIAVALERIALERIGLEPVRVPVDALGRFALSPAPRGAARLRLDDGSGRLLVTDWFVS